MDEPTNHVDIPGQEKLEAEILEHEATCVLVSHDRSFVRNIGTRYLQIDGKRLREVEGPGGIFRGDGWGGGVREVSSGERTSSFDRLGMTSGEGAG